MELRVRLFDEGSAIYHTHNIHTSVSLTRTDKTLRWKGKGRGADIHPSLVLLRGSRKIKRASALPPDAFVVFTVEVVQGSLLSVVRASNN